jgi:hypothetical protein
MSYAKRMLDTYPRDFNLDAGILAATIDALSDCAQACTACADDCLSEEMVCMSCGDECGRHAQMHEHCRVCAEACRRCEQACNDLLAAMK